MMVSFGQSLSFPAGQGDRPESCASDHLPEKRKQCREDIAKRIRSRHILSICIRNVGRKLDDGGFSFGRSCWPKAKSDQAHVGRWGKITKLRVTEERLGES